jgi:tetratricopeptide (TPR) repeat protein
MLQKLFLLFVIIVLSKQGFAQDTEFYNLYFEGNALLSKGENDKAIDRYTKAAKLFPADYVYFNRGNAYYRKKDLQNALLDYSKTIKMNDEYAEAYFQRGMTKVTLADKTACEDLKKADKLKLDGAKEAFKQHCK